MFVILKAKKSNKTKKTTFKFNLPTIFNILKKKNLRSLKNYL